jgi:uncharacterized MAPEG superfamily protein
MTDLHAPMTVPILCIVAAYFLVYLPHFLAGSQRFKQPGGFDNTHPRDQSARLEGWARRAAAAHANGHETFAPFALAVVVAWIGHASRGTVATLAMTYVVLRALYVAAYIGNVAPVRSLLWTASFAITVALFLLPLFS